LGSQGHSGHAGGRLLRHLYSPIIIAVLSVWPRFKKRV
jgi:hypothetical protein